MVVGAYSCMLRTLVCDNMKDIARSFAARSAFWTAAVSAGAGSGHGPYKET